MSLTNLESIGRSPAFRVVAIGALILCLQIPVLFTYGLLSERESTKNRVVREIAAGWGDEQELVGPYLVVPYRTANTGKSIDQLQFTIRWTEHTATFLPASLNIDASVAGQRLQRGIYESSTYSADVELEGIFERPNLKEWDAGETEVHWNRARLVFEVADARGVREFVTTNWNGQNLAFEPGTGTIAGGREALQANLGEGDLDADELPFVIAFNLHGSKSLRFAPVGHQTETVIKGTWPSPSYQGSWLPDARDSVGDEFSASWSIPFLGRSLPKSWTGMWTNSPPVSQFGVDLLTPVDAYRQTERSLKYELLFLALTFAPLWLFEVLAGIRLHFIQYGLIGAAVCLFYLLELSLSEHIGFAGAYTLAASMIAALVTSYAWSILGSVSRAASMGGIISGLYGFLYVLISLEDFALLAGSLALFLVLAALMYATRRVNWFHLGRPQSDVS